MSQTAAGVARTESLEAQDPHRDGGGISAEEEKKNKKNKRPASMFFLSYHFTSMGE